jgi:hypothetical protein
MTLFGHEQIEAVFSVQKNMNAAWKNFNKGVTLLIKVSLKVQYRYLYVLNKGRERNPPPCSHYLGQVVYGCVRLWRQRVAQLPIPHPPAS